MKQLEDLKRERGEHPGFKVPEGYFENFTQNMMQQIPEATVAQELAPTSFFVKMKPSLYMAAMFAAIIITLKLFVTTGTTEDTMPNGGFTTFEQSNNFDPEYYQDYYNDYSMTNYELSSMDEYSQVESFVHFAGL